jgi:hypothetical protein
MATTHGIDAALAALALEDKPNLSQVARDYGVNRLQLYRRHKGICRSISEAREHQHLLSNDQQKVLVEHINYLSGLGIPPTTSMVRVFAWEICQKWPGENWVARFVLSHKDELRSAFLSGFELKRKRADNYYLIQKYFEMVSTCKFTLSHANNLSR